jgi:hypothetical protein
VLKNMVTSKFRFPAKASRYRSLPRCPSVPITGHKQTGFWEVALFLDVQESRMVKILIVPAAARTNRTSSTGS